MLALRQRVFVVEQRCAFLDADGRDLAAEHLLGSLGGQLVAYLRLLAPGAPGAEEDEAVIGRVLTAPDARGCGLGRELMERGIVRARERWPGCAIRVVAQCHVESFYRGLGFRPVAPAFDEDGIAHVPMVHGRAAR